jgi:hypothetical protein
MDENISHDHAEAPPCHVNNRRYICKHVKVVETCAINGG